VKTSDDVRIRFGLWPGSKGYVLIYPGRTEYIEKYGRVITRLRERGLGCVILDWRNQGLSDRAAKTGHVLDYDEYQRDIGAVLDTQIVRDLDARPHLLSHSMGGLIALGSLRRGVDVKSAIFSAPMWGMGLAPPVRAALKLIANTASNLGLGTGKVLGSKRGSYIKTADPQGNTLMSDPETVRWIQRQLNTYPHLSLGGPSWAWLRASHQEIGRLESYGVPDLPTLTVLGSEESVVDAQAIRDRVTLPENGKLFISDGAKHEVLMETPDIQDLVWTEMDKIWGVRPDQAFRSSSA